MKRIVVAAIGCITLTAAAPRTVSRADTVLVVSVSDAANGAFIADAQVRLPSVGRVARTRWDGEAYFPAMPAGRYRVQVRAIGYAPGDIDMQVKGDTSAIFFQLERIPAAMDTVRVAATRLTRGLKEFEDRRRVGIGRFITDSAIAEHRAQGLQLLLATGVPGLAVSGRGVLSAEPSPRGGPCPVLFYLDGFKLSGDPLRRGGSMTLDLDTIRPEDLAGIEVYSRTSAPAQYKPSGDYCKVILLWTKW